MHREWSPTELPRINFGKTLKTILFTFTGTTARQGTKDRERVQAGPHSANAAPPSGGRPPGTAPSSTAPSLSTPALVEHLPPGVRTSGLRFARDALRYLFRFLSRFARGKTERRKQKYIQYRTHTKNTTHEGRAVFCLFRFLSRFAKGGTLR